MDIYSIFLFTYIAVLLLLDIQHSINDARVSKGRTLHIGQAYTEQEWKQDCAYAERHINGMFHNL